MSIDLIAKIAPKNDGFTGMVDADQVIGDGATNVLPDAVFPATDAMPQYVLRQPIADTVINDSGGDFNFRIEGDTDVNLLFLDAGEDRVGIGTATPKATLHVGGTDGIIVPTGTTDERVATQGIATQGMVRYNTTTSKFEGYTGAAWVDFH